MADPEREHIPIRLRPIYDELVSRTDAVCREHLNEEYAQLCQRLAAALCRKRPSPVTRGRIDSWACGIAYAIGSVNFLADKSQTPHATMAELCGFFGVSPATVPRRQPRSAASSKCTRWIPSGACQASSTTTHWPGSSWSGLTPVSWTGGS